MRCTKQQDQEPILKFRIIIAIVARIIIREISIFHDPEK
jgi:hypothetical protein